MNQLNRRIILLGKLKAVLLIALMLTAMAGVVIWGGWQIQGLANSVQYIVPALLAIFIISIWLGHWVAALVFEKEALKSKMRDLSMMDIQTGLPNRRAFFDQLSRSVSHAERTSEDLSLLMIEIDRFNRMNHEYGHAVADKSLATLANVLVECAREDDFIGHLGVDQFAILMPGTKQHEAMLLSDRIQDALKNDAKHREHQPADIAFNVSVGVASAKLDGAMSVSDFFHAAGVALANQKQNRADVSAKKA